MYTIPLINKFTEHLSCSRIDCTVRGHLLRIKRFNLSNSKQSSKKNRTCGKTLFCHLTLRYSSDFFILPTAARFQVRDFILDTTSSKLTCIKLKRLLQTQCCNVYTAVRRQKVHRKLVANGNLRGRALFEKSLTNFVMFILNTTRGGKLGG